jgi:hypothetical protein
MQEKVLLWGAFQIFDLPDSGISNPEGARGGTFSYTKRFWLSLETCGGFGKTEGGRRHSPSTRVFLSLSHLVPSATDPGELSLPSLSLSPSRSSVCLSTAPHTFPTYAHCLALHLNTEVPYCGGPGSRTLIEKATRLILQKLLQP